MPQQRDIRATPLYREVEGFFRAIHAPGEECVTDAAELTLGADGTKAAFTATIYPSLDQPPRTRIALLDPRDGTIHVMPSDAGNDRLPRFSPDGGALAFLSDSAQPGVFQPYLCDAHGGSRRALPAIDGVVESLAWSRDGRFLLLAVAGLGADMAGCQGGATVAHAPDPLPAWLPRVDSGDAENLWRRMHVVDTVTGQMRAVHTPGVNIWECAWLNDREVVAVVSDSHSEGSWYRSRLIAASIDGGAVRELHRPADQIGCPVASPSGRHVAWIEAVCSDRLIVCGTLCVIGVDDGSVIRPDTHGIDVTQALWRDDRTLTLIGLRGLQTAVAEIRLADGSFREIWSGADRSVGAWYPSMELLPREGVLVVGEAYDVPPEIARIDARGYSVIRSLATPAAQAPGFSKAECRTHCWSAPDGLEIQGFLITPPGPGPWPLVMDIHGGPVWACRNRWQGRLRGAKTLADHGIASLYPNPRGSSGRGQAFASLVKGDMGGEDTYDYLTGIDSLVTAGIADPKRLGVTGISYGGFMSAWLVTQDARFIAAVPISVVSNWYSQHRTSQIPYFDAWFLDGEPAAPNGLFFQRSPVMHADRVRTPVLQLTGALDQNTPPTQALEFHRSLLEHGVVSELATYPTAGHGIRSFPPVIDATTRYVGWFLRYFELDSSTQSQSARSDSKP